MVAVGIINSFFCRKPKTKNKGAYMQKERVVKKRLLTSTSHPLLNLKEVIDILLGEGSGLPPDVKQMLVQTRDSSWKAFVESQEKLNNSLR